MMRLTVACCAGMFILCAAACSPRCDCVQNVGADGTGSDVRNDALDAVAELEPQPEVPSAEEDASATDVDAAMDGREIDARPPQPILRLFLCDESYEGCVDVDTLATPYLRRNAWMKGTVEGGSVGGTSSISMLIDGDPRPCKGGGVVDGACRVALQTVGLLETISVILIATFDNGSSRLEKNWMVPVFDCALESGRTVCLDHTSWEEQNDVPVNMAWYRGYGAFEAASDEDGRLYALAVDRSAAIDDPYRVWLARLDGGAWSTRLLQDWIPTPGRPEQFGSPAMGIVASHGRVWITGASNVPGHENAWYNLSIAEVTDAGIEFEVIDLCAVCPSDLPCPRGGWANPVMRVGADGTKHVFVATSFFPGLYLVNSGDGWRCEAIRAPFDTGATTSDSPVGESLRLALGPGGLVHLAYVTEGGYRVVYKTGSFGAWTDLFLPPGYAPWLDLDVDDANRAHYVISRLDATIERYLIEHGAAISQVDLTAQAVVACEGNPECHIPATEPWQFDEYHVSPVDVSLVTDSCRRDHVLIPSGKIESVYLTNLHGAWTGTPVPEFGSPAVGYWPQAPLRMFQLPNGDLHALYLEDYPAPQPSRARIRHWIRKCTETLVE